MAMSLRDQKKLTDAGFFLFRLELREKKIKIARTPGNWKTYMTFPTQKKCQEKWDFLMINNKAVSG